MQMSELEILDKEIQVQLKRLEASFEAGMKIDNIKAFKEASHLFFKQGYLWAKEEEKK